MRVRGTPLARLFEMPVDVETGGDTIRLRLHDAAIVSSLLRVRSLLNDLPKEIKKVIVDVSGVRLVDHTVLERLPAMSQEWPEAELEIVGSTHRFTAQLQVWM